MKIISEIKMVLTYNNNTERPVKGKMINNIAFVEEKTFVPLNSL